MNLSDAKKLYKSTLESDVKYSLAQIYCKLRESIIQGHTFVMFYYGNPTEQDEVSESQMEILKQDGYTIRVVDGIKKKFYEVSGWS